MRDLLSAITRPRIPFDLQLFKGKLAPGARPRNAFHEALENGTLEEELAGRSAEVIETTRAAALHGPLAKKILEAAGLKADVDIAKLTDEQKDAIDKQLGFTAESFVDKIIETVGPNEGEGEHEGEHEEGEEEPEDEQDGESGREPEALSKEKIESMKPEELKKELLRRRDPAKFGESVRKRAEAAEAKLLENDRTAFLNRIFAELKFPEGPHRELAASLVESLTDPKAVVKRLRAYVEANITAQKNRGVASGVVGTTRESEGGGLVRLTTGVKRQEAK